MPPFIGHETGFSIHRLEQATERKIDVFSIGFELHAHAFSHDIEDLEGNCKRVVVAQTLVTACIGLPEREERKRVEKDAQALDERIVAHLIARDGRVIWQQTEDIHRDVTPHFPGVIEGFGAHRASVADASPLARPPYASAHNFEPTKN